MTEQANPASADFDALSTLEMLAVFNREDRRVAGAVERELGPIARLVDETAAALLKGGRLFYTGAGTSGRLGVLDASECPPTFNVPPDLVVGIIAGGEGALRSAAEGSEDSPEAGARDLLARGFTSRDVLVGIAASGRTPYVLGAVDAANGLGALTACVVCSPDSELASRVRIPIVPLPGPEVITGSTRLKAGTATKLVLNMISSGVMVRLGYVYSNLMVNVQPRNEKLVDRAQRIIMAVTGCERERAARLLEESGRNVRTAIVMGRLNVSRAQAESRLDACGGRVREAIG
ncbi:MAG: N-acetylmuramic acid 6-phosphate etherase [Candidatus Solibacter usitatus]|nr:N-acetylmuramic acid 6-phosphate etherase [Candidatus Solibacter usitatus]